MAIQLFATQIYCLLYFKQHRLSSLAFTVAKTQRMPLLFIILKLQLLIPQYDQLLRLNINLYFLFFISLSDNHAIMPAFSESLANGKNKCTSCDLIRDFTVETASKSRHIQNSKWITKTLTGSLIRRQLGLLGKFVFEKNVKASIKMQVKLCFDMNSVHCLLHHNFSPEKIEKNICS